MRARLVAVLLLGGLALGLGAAGCAGGGNGDAVSRPPCERGDTRAGCEQERIECIDPKRCY